MKSTFLAQIDASIEDGSFWLCHPPPTQGSADTQQELIQKLLLSKSFKEALELSPATMGMYTVILTLL